MLPYGKQTIDADDVQAVIEALSSDWLTTGPMVAQFENAIASATSTLHAVAVSSGTAALHTAMFAAGVGNQDEVIVPAITFAATSNAAIYLGAKPVFADIDPDTMLLDPDSVEEKITPRTRAIVAMDYAGQPCDYAALKCIADQHNLILIADACHSLGGSVGATPVGSLADLTCFSFHPIKQITSGEGGVIVTNDSSAAAKMKTFRNHGITTDHRQRERLAKHRYSMESLGFNYRLTDIQCALGLSQLSKLDRFTRMRNDIAETYNSLLDEVQFVRPLKKRPGIDHAYHLYAVHWDQLGTGISRDEAFDELRNHGIGVNVHYQPVYQHPFYVEKYGDQTGSCPNAESAYETILSLPIFPLLAQTDIHRVVRELKSIGESASIVVRRAA